MIMHCGEMIGTWEIMAVRQLLIHDFQPEERSGEDWTEEVACELCAMDLLLIADSMGRPLSLEQNGILVPDPTVEHLERLQNVVGNSNRVLKAYASLVGVNIQQRTRSVDFSSEIVRHYQSTPEPEPLVLAMRISTLNDEQFPLFERIVGHVERREHALIHIDAPAGCGKTYLCQTVLHSVRSMGLIGLCCATTGIAALQYEIGRTAHNLFQLPLHEDKDIVEGTTIDSRLLSVLEANRNSVRLELLRNAAVVIWDEIGMAHRALYEAVDRLLRALMRTPDIPFGGKVFITLGDWRQICPVDHDSASRFVDRSDKQAFATSAFHTSILSSSVWPSFSTFRLNENERCKLHPDFHERLMRFGNGVDGDEIPIELLRGEFKTTTSLEESLTWLYESFTDDETRVEYDPERVARRAFISPFNADVDMINEWCSQRMAAMKKVHLQYLKSVDTFDSPDSVPCEPGLQGLELDHTLDDHVMHAEQTLNAADIRYADDNDQQEQDDENPFLTDFEQIVSTQHLAPDTFTTEVLHQQNFPGIPPHLLCLAVGMVVVLLRNLDHSKHLMNGTRLVVVRIKKNIVIVRHAIATAKHRGNEEFVIPRIRFSLLIGGQESRIIRMQFPLRPAFAITIHKSQASTMERTVVDLRTGVFDHGQLYVALSRVCSPDDLLLLINEDQQSVKNIVHEILLKIGRVL